MDCPNCKTPLQRLAGQDGYRIDQVWNMDSRDGRMREVRSTDTVFACASCEYAVSGEKGGR